jgi:dihydropteroate synthase
MFKQPRSVQVIVYRDSPGGREYLLLWRQIGADGFWQPVSGSLEPGEGPLEAAARELAEETGLQTATALSELGLVNRFPIAPAWREKYALGVTHNVQEAYAALVAPGDIVLDAREHTAHVWAGYEQARALLRYDENRRALDLVEHGIPTGARRTYRLRLPRRELELGRHTLVMGVLNVTPDSFSDGGRYLDPCLAVDRALEMQEEGVDIVDVGGESSRPGAEPVGLDEELSRVVPVVERLAAELRVPISVDTTRASTARAALGAGAEIVNDISALRFDPGLADAAAAAGAAVVLMHMRGDPSVMQKLEPSPDIFAEVEKDLLEAINVATERGVPFERLVLDPGIGFGKTVDQNVALVARLGRLARLDRPLLVGTSRKSFLGRLTGRETPDRLAATLASVTAAVLAGAHVVRVHDVAPAVDAVRVADAVLAARGEAGESPEE